MQYLIPKDNGRWAVYSTVSDLLVADDMTDKDYVEARVADAAREARRLAESDIADMRAGKDTPEFDYEFAVQLDARTRREAAEAAAEDGTEPLTPDR